MVAIDGETEKTQTRRQRLSVDDGVGWTKERAYRCTKGTEDIRTHKGGGRCVRKTEERRLRNMSTQSRGTENSMDQTDGRRLIVDGRRDRQVRPALMFVLGAVPMPSSSSPVPSASSSSSSGSLGGVSVGSSLEPE